MPELRKDPIVGRWVIISTERARRPGNIINRYHSFSLLDDEQREQPVGKWDLQIAESQNPIVSASQPIERKKNGLYDVVSGYGHHQIITDTSEKFCNFADLDLPRAKSVIEAYALEYQKFREDSNIHYCYAYKKYNGSGEPTNSQVIATPVIPLHVIEQLEGAQAYYQKNHRNIFMDLINQEMEQKVRLVSESEHFVVVTPFAPRFPFELWVVPRQQHCDFKAGIEGKEEDLARVLKQCLTKYKTGLSDPDYHFAVNSAPFFENDKDNVLAQKIEQYYCWHIEIVPQLTHIAGFEKGTGFYICSIPPEITADFLRDIDVEAGKS